MSTHNVIPMSIADRARLRFVRSLREFADSLEQAPPCQLPDLLIRLPISEVEKGVEILRRCRL